MTYGPTAPHHAPPQSVAWQGQSRVIDRRQFQPRRIEARATHDGTRIDGVAGRT